MIKIQDSATPIRQDLLSFRILKRRGIKERLGKVLVICRYVSGFEQWKIVRNNGKSHKDKQNGQRVYIKFYLKNCLA